MSEENIQVEYRRRRVKRLKKCIILMLMISIAIPYVLCMVLLVRMRSLEGELEKLTALTEELTHVAESQQERLEELTRNTQSQGQGTAATSEADAVLPGYGLESPDVGQGEGTEEKFPEETAEVTAAHRVYLTFDDGPSIYTQDILDILDRYDVKATFFVVGKETESAKKSLKRIVEDGHALGMHSYSHVYSEVYASVDNFAGDFTKLRDYLYEVTGVKSSIYRFPGGSSNTVSKIPMGEFADYLDSQGVVFFDWNISSGDALSEKLSAEAIVKNCTENITRYGTSVILLHDTAEKKSTVEALPMIIENILALEDTVILPITEDTEPVQHIHWSADKEEATDKRANGGLE